MVDYKEASSNPGGPADGCAAAERRTRWATEPDVGNERMQLLLLGRVGTLGRETIW